MTDDKNIIRYLDWEMEEDERLSFEKEISGNPDLAEKVEAFRNLQKLAGKAIRQADDPEESLDKETREEIRQAVMDFKEGKNSDLPGEVNETIKSARQAFEQRREKGQQSMGVSGTGSQRSNLRQIRRIWFSAAAIAAVAVIVSLLLVRHFKGRPAKDLYTEYYKEFLITSEMIELSRADDDLLFAIKVYEAGDYERAVILFEMLADSAGLREYALFYAGQSYLHQNLTDKAIETFQQLLGEASGDMIPLTRWYLALCYLKTGEAALAKEQLMLLDETDSPFRRDARLLMRDLQ
jgi:tetratricopeptide (TPR) repeat protein